MEYFWKKKTIITYILSVFVFLIHISSFSNYSNAGDFISGVNLFLSRFFSQVVTSSAVTCFFIISGILFYRNYNNSLYVDKLKSRIRTLFIPYLSWNFIWMLFAIVTSYTFISSFFIGREKFILSISNVLNAIFHYGCNGPFWFIFELMFFVLIAPLINLIINNKYIGIFTGLLLLLLAVKFDIGLPSPLFYSKQALSHYIIGGVIGKHYFDVVSLKLPKKISLIFAGIVFFCWGIVYFETGLPGFIKALLNIANAISFWFAMDIFTDKMKMYNFYSRSFAVYAMHVNVSAIVCKLYYLILPKNQWFAFPNFVLTLVTTLVLINAFCLIVKKFLPKLSGVLMGER